MQWFISPLVWLFETTKIWIVLLTTDVFKAVKSYNSPGVSRTVFFIFLINLLKAPVEQYSSCNKTSPFTARSVPSSHRTRKLALTYSFRIFATTSESKGCEECLGNHFIEAIIFHCRSFIDCLAYRVSRSKDKRYANRTTIRSWCFVILVAA